MMVNGSKIDLSQFYLKMASVNDLSSNKNNQNHLPNLNVNNGDYGKTTHSFVWDGVIYNIFGKTRANLFV